jgi:hypothetical protein
MAIKDVKQLVDATLKSGHMDEHDRIALLQATGRYTNSKEAEEIGKLAEAAKDGRVQTTPVIAASLDSMAIADAPAAQRKQALDEFASGLRFPFDAIHSVQAQAGRGSLLTFAAGLAVNALLAPVVVPAAALYGLFVLNMD